MMKKLLLAFTIAALIGPAGAHGQAYPSRPITIVVGLPPGVGTDAVGRTIAGHMKTSLGQPVVFENATGAGGTIGTARVATLSPRWLHPEPRQSWNPRRQSCYLPQHSIPSAEGF